MSKPRNCASGDTGETAKHPTRFIATAAVIAALGLTSGCASTDATSTSTPTASHTTAASPSWSYSGSTGPSAWGDLSSDYEACRAGEAQSPVDLPATAPTTTASATFTSDAVSPVHGEDEDNGHTLEFAPEGVGSTVTFEGVEYQFAQMHYHTPSEHTIDGKPASAEFHFVHKSADGKLLVLGVLAKVGSASKALGSFIDAAPATHETAATLDIEAILDGSSGARTYSGSLTTPPCTEGVRWIVLSAPITISADQLAALKAVHDGNARPTQPLHGRQVTGADLTAGH